MKGVLTIFMVRVSISGQTKLEAQLEICHSTMGGGDAQNVDVDLGHFLDVDCRLQGFKKCRIYKEFL